jgi:hypothetical protein
MHTVQTLYSHSKQSVRQAILSNDFPLITEIALYNLDIGWGFQLLFALSSQVIGMSLAGIFRRFLVWLVRALLDSTAYLSTY